MTWAAQMCALVIFPESCGTNSGLYDWSLSTDTVYTGLLSLYLRMSPDLFTVFSITVFLMFQVYMMPKEEYLPSGQEILMIGLQVLLLKTWT